MDTQLFPNFITKHPFFVKNNKLLWDEFELLTLLIGNNIYIYIYICIQLKHLLNFFLSLFFFYNFWILRNTKKIHNFFFWFKKKKNQ